MVKKLRKRLTIIFTVFTGGVLAVILGLSLWHSLEQISVSYTSMFSSDTSYIAASVSSYASNKDDLSWVSGMEKQNSYLINIKKDDEELEYEHGYKDNAEREKIFAEAEEQAESMGTQYTVQAANAVSAFLVNSSTIISDYASVTQQQPLIISIEQNTEGTLEENTNAKSFHFSAAESTVEPEEYNETTVPAGKAIRAASSDSSEMQELMLDSVSVSYALGGVVASPYLTYKGPDGTNYFINSVKFNDENNSGTTYEILVLADRTKEYREISLTVLSYAGLLIAGILLLTLISFFISKLVLRSTEEGIKRQTEFVAAASHELRNPIAVIRSNLEASRLDTEQSEEYIGSAEREAVRMSKLIDNLLSLAGTDSAQLKTSTEPFDLDTLLISTEERFKPLADNKNLTISLVLPEEVLGEVNSDKSKVAQILTIFIDNAIGYSKEGSSIEIKGSKHKSQFQLSVIDHAVGIPDEEKSKVFDRFYQSDDSRTDKNHFGLGLSIAKELAEDIDGVINVSDTAGGGATFQLSFGSQKMKKK